VVVGGVEKLVAVKADTEHGPVAEIGPVVDVEGLRDRRDGDRHKKAEVHLQPKVEDRKQLVEREM
jgi:hypothetical protein